MKFRAAILSAFFISAGCAPRETARPGEPDPREDLPGLSGTWVASVGQGEERTLALRPGGRWQYEDASPSGALTARRGRWLEEDHRVILEVEAAAESSTDWSENPEWKPARARAGFEVFRWGKRVYLLQDDAWLDFVNAVNQGAEPRGCEDGWFLLRKGDERESVEGPPPVPEEWAPWLLPQPVRGRVIDVLADGSAVADAGERDGLKKGMLLTARAADGAAWVQARIVSVQEDRCIIAREYDAGTPPFAEGMSVSTRFKEAFGDR